MWAFMSWLHWWDGAGGGSGPTVPPGAGGQIKWITYYFRGRRR